MDDDEVRRNCICNTCGEEFIYYDDFSGCPYCTSLDIDCEED
jgi:Zn finger protein HypA/HybF involved in hydrogenase expression